MASNATITTSELAPDGAVRYSLGSSESFELSAGESKEVPVTDRELLQCASDHPWLTVEYPSVEGYEADYKDPHVPPAEDVLAAAHGSLANDPEAAAAAEAAKPENVDHYTAIDAGLDQGEEHYIGYDDRIAQTIAADTAHAEADESDDDKTEEKV